MPTTDAKSNAVNNCEFLPVILSSFQSDVEGEELIEVKTKSDIAAMHSILGVRLALPKSWDATSPRRRANSHSLSYGTIILGRIQTQLHVCSARRRARRRARLPKSWDGHIPEATRKLKLWDKLYWEGYKRNFTFAGQGDKQGDVNSIMLKLGTADCTSVTRRYS